LHWVELGYFFYPTHLYFCDIGLLLEFNIFWIAFKLYWSLFIF